MNKPQKIYPAPVDIGAPPEVIREWAMKVIASWDLTPKEREVCDLMLKGLATKEISEVTGNKDKTLKHHINVIFRKAHVSSRSELFSEILRL